MNKDDLDFDNAESTVPTQEWDLVEDNYGQDAEYSTRYLSFSLPGAISHDRAIINWWLLLRDALKLMSITDNWAILLEQITITGWQSSRASAA